MTDLAVLAAMGLAGAGHCAGMCGGLAALTGKGFHRFLLYSAGRGSSYVMLGALAGALGRTVPLGTRWLGMAGGVFLLLAGLAALDLLPTPNLPLTRVTRWLAELACAGPAGSLLAGALNGLLPCPLVYAFVGWAAATGSMLRGGAAMLVLAATSMLPLGACALAGRRFASGRRAAAILMIAMGILMAWRGLMRFCH